MNISNSYKLFGLNVFRTNNHKLVGIFHRLVFKLFIGIKRIDRGENRPSSLGLPLKYNLKSLHFIFINTTVKSVNTICLKTDQNNLMHFWTRNVICHKSLLYGMMVVSGDCCQKVPTVQTRSFVSRLFED
jgi:hypothetical protein